LQARAADEARYSEVAEDFKAALPDAFFNYILILRIRSNNRQQEKRKNYYFLHKYKIKDIINIYLLKVRI
jgi:hypothetical protein